MAGKFDNAQKLAQRLIAENGEDVVLTVYTTTIPDSAKPWIQAQSVPQDVPAKGVFLNYTVKEAGTTYSDGTEIHQDDKKVLVAALGLSGDPNLHGTITRASGSKYRILRVKLLDPNGQKILFELHARRG